VTLTAREVAEITRLLEDSSFDELYLELDGLKLSLRRGAAVSAHAPGNSDAASSAPVSSGAAAPSAPVVGQPPAAVDSTVRDITAPLLGTFYRAPKPGAPPFVEVGSLVEADSIIGIIEVMKLMNTVRAGIRGKVVEIQARDGTLVEYGETLLRVETIAGG
jgi:acetyl-CoA carboxylase biotin carboxyl carrier protein